MDRSQSCRKLATEPEKSVDMRRAFSQPLYPPQTTNNELNTAASSSNVRSSTGDMRRRIVQLNRELEQERMQIKNLRRDKAIEVRQVREEEQKKAASMQADLRSKLHKEKVNELTSLRQQLYKEKEKDILQIMRKKDENLKSSQQAWAREKDELKAKVRGEIGHEAREEAKREFERERVKLEQEISDLTRQRDMLEDTLKLVQGADKRKIDDIRRIHHEHEAELEKVKRNSWQESRKQMAEIRQLLNIIEQLEKKLGLEAGHSMRLRLEKDNLYDMLKKSTTFDAWDRMMSSSTKHETQIPPQPTTDVKGNSQELRILQRKNVELSSLVRKLDEKNQQLATRNAELLAELEKLEKGNRDKNRKLERNNADLLQTNKRLETRNKLLLDEINTLKQNKTSTGRKENTAKPRGKAEKEREELANLKAQLREQTRDIADLKQSLMEKDRRIELLRGRKKNEKRKSVGVSSQSIDSLSVPDDDAISVHSDYSDQSNDDIDSRRVKKLAKELLALERAYALLQAHVGSAVDAERDEMERQQLQSDLIQSQARIHELERMMNNGGQGGSDGISQLQADNKALYQKLMMAEKERDQAQEELTKHSEDMRDLQDQRDLLEFELEELSQLSTAASEDWDNKRPNSSTSVDSLPATEHESSVLSFEEVKACLEELETEKKKMLSLVEQNALRQAREMLDSMAEEISHLQITESALRGKVRDLDLGYNSESLKSELHDLTSPSIVTYDQETLTDPLWVENQDVEVTHKKQRLESLESLRNTGLGVQKEDRASLTDLMLGDLVNLESVYKDYLESFPLQTAQAKAGQFELGKRDGECMTDLVWGDLEQLENTYRERLEDLWRLEENSQQTKGEVEKVDNETMTHLDLDEVDELENVCPLCRRNREVTLKVDNEAMTEIFWDDLVEQTHNEIYMSLSNELGANLRDEGETQREKSEVGVMTDLEWSELVDLENTYLECIDYVQEMESKFNVKKEDVATSTDGASSSEYECSLPFTARDIETKHCHVMTDLGYEDIVDLQHKCTDYSQKLEELQNKLAQFNVRKDEKSSITNISLQDLALLESIGEQMLKSSVKLRDAETNTDSAISDISYESLPSVVLETYPGDLETKDECDMTEGIWDEVVELQNTYRDYRQNLDEMNVKSAQFKVQKDDKESITDITMQNIAELESMYKEHLIIDNSDKNSTVSQTEKETRGCMTEMTMVVLTELEDFYIENAARDTQAPALEVEKWERESMTEITAEDIQYLEEVEELYQQREWGEDGKIETEERSVETDMTFDDIDYLQEIQAAHVECVSRENEEERSKHVEMVEIGTNTDQTIPDLEHLEELGEVYQNMVAFSKPLEPQPLMSLEREDRGVSTDLTAFDLKYLEDVEAAHEECLLDREDDELKAQLFGGDTRSKEMQSVEIMTDLALSDLKYWEDIEAAHEECLLDKEEEFRSSDFLKDMQNVEIMTDLALSDLKYWEDVEAAHEECLLDKEEECRSRDVTRDMQSVEIMTDLALSDLKYLEDVEAAHEECLLDKEEECRSRDVNKDMQSVEIMTDLALSDLKYWEDVEAAHEECLVDKEEECRSRDVNKDMQSVGIITDLTVEDLKYLEDAHEECILDKEEEEARDSTVKDQHSVGTMTDLAAFDLCRIQEITTLVSEREGKSSENEQEEKRRGSMSSSLNVLHENKNTMTELTGDILEYLKDIESTYKETLEQFEEFKSVYAVTKGHKHVTKSDKDLTTDVTVAKMTHLEETEQQPLICGSEKDHKETMTDLIQDDLEYVLEVNSSYQDLVVEKSDAEVMTDLTLSYLKQVEDEFKRLKAKEDYSGKDEKESMTDLTNFELQYLEEVECLFRERDDNKEDTETMTDLTTADLEHLEGAENQLKTLSSNRDIPTLLVPTEDKGVITDITSSDVEYLQMLLEREVSFFDSAVEKDDKSTETALTVADIRDLEDQAYTAAEVKTTPQFKEMVKEDLQVETLVDLQSELDHLPVLDEPEFIFDEEDSEEDQEKVEVGVMTDLTGFELSNPELSMKAFYQRDSTDFENRLQVSTNEMGIQCELSGVSLMKEEPGKETKNAKGIVPRFVSAVNLRSPDGGLSPVHLVVRQNDLSNAAPHELPNDSFPDDVLEQTSPLDFSVSNEHESLPLSSTWNEDACLPETGGSDEQKMESSSQDTGVQCGVADLLSMMEEYHKDTSEEDMPSWFVSAMSMTRNSTGFNPVEVVLRKLSGSSVSDDNGTERPSRGHRHSTNLTIELSRPLARSSTVTVNFPPSDSLDNEFECPEADAPLFTSVNASDNVFLETEGSIAPPTDEEEMDVLEDMPQYSAVNRFDRFLKERKDSELKNLQALRDLGESIDGTKLSKDLQEENERLKEKIKQLEDETILKELQDENELLKEQIQNENELEEENALLKERVQQLEEEANFKELEMENEILKEKLPVLEELPALKDLEEANTLLKEEVNALRKSNISDQLEEENALLQEELAASSLEIKNKNAENESLKLRIHDVEETTNQKLNELEEENELLKENIQILEETTTVEREENEELKEKIQHLEESTARAVEKLDEENSALKDKIQLLEGEAMSKAELVDSTKEQNTLLREKIQQLETSVGDQVEIEQENASLKEKIRTLESSTQYRRLSEEDLELLQLKIEQLKEAEKQIGTLNESNVALREKLDLLQFAKRNVRDNSSEMDPTEQLGKADRGVQAVQDVPPSVHQEMQTVPIISGAVSQGIQTNLDLITTEEPVREGPIPEHINSELQKLKDDNRELYEELMELREEAKDRERQVTEHLHLPQAHEATQTEHAQPWDQVSIEVTSPVLDAPRDAISPVPSSIEETITRILRSTAASEIGNLEERVLQFEKEPVIPTIVVGRADLENGIDGIDALVDEDKGKSESIKEDVCYLGDVISEPDKTSVGKTPKSVMDGVGTLDYLVEDEGNNKARTDTSYSIDFDLDESLPPLPESSPPPLPSGPPPDFPDASPPVLEYGVETLLLNESTPPRDAASLRASSRQRYHSSGRPSSESSRPSSRVESPVLVKENTLTLETEPSEYGTIPDDASLDSPEGQSEKPSLSDSKQGRFESRSKAGPPVLPKPKRPSISSRLPGQLSQPAASVVKPTMTSSLPTQWSRDEDGVFPPRGVVRTRASSLNRGEIDALNEKIGFLERQLRNKENVIRSMKTEATELETQSLLERKDREIKILEEDNAFLKQENQKKERELLSKIGEVNKKGYETEQWKAEANNSERQRQRMEAAYLNLQNQLKTLEGADRKLAELQTKHSDAEKQNWDLSEKVKKLERTEKEFKKLEHNIQVLQTQVQGMDNLEQNRNELMDKMRVIENQRDDLLRKGRVVESERNDFLRNNKLMEMQRDESENRCALLQKTNTTLNARLDELEQDLKQAQTKMHDSQHERNYLQVQLDKMEAEKNELQQRLATVTQERNSLENQVAELQDLSRDHVKLEDGFHTLRIKLAELTREKDDAEMQIPTLKAKVSLLKRACKEKDGLVDRLNEEIRELRHSIATSALDDLSKIRSYGYSPENFVKLSAQRDHDRERVKRHSEDLIEARLNGTTEKSPSNHESKSFQPSPPGTKKAKRFVALFDYDPYNSPTSEHPELEVKLHEGDYLTVFGDMDINGYFEADVNGVRGLVSSLYVEEVDDDDDSDLGLDDHKSKPHMSPLKKGSLYKSNGLPQHKDKIAEGMVSVGPSSAGSEPRLCLVALDDYNPSRSGTVGHLAHEQVVMKKGDVMMAFGDMDVNGFYRVKLNGQNGFVPGHMVEEVSSSSFLQPTSSRTPEQILGMLDNVPVRSQPQVSRDVLTPAPFSSNTYPTQALIDVVSPSYVPPHSRPLSHVGITRFQPSPEVALIGTLSHSLPSASPPRNSTQAAMVPSSRVEKTLTTYSQPLTSTHIVPVSKRPRSSKKARPSSPGVLRILRPVNHDAMLVGWTLPEMDEFGRSRGLVVKGYKIYSNGDVKLDVRSPYMAKALVEDLDLRFPIKFSIKTVAENGSSSESVSAMFSDTIKGAALDSSGESYDDSGDEKPYRTFVALYDYDPCKSSPNPNPACEMSFREGDILRVFDTTRKDGFYFGKLKNKKGLIPSNFVEEVAVASPRRLEAAKKLHASRSSPSRPFSRSSSSSEGVNSPVGTKDSAPVRRKLMVATYDYNPEEQSPQDDTDSELPFKKGQVIVIMGEMRADGFYQADIGGELGLVPASFLDEYSNTDTDSGLESGRRVSFEKGRSQRRVEDLERT